MKLQVCRLVSRINGGARLTRPDPTAGTRGTHAASAPRHAVIAAEVGRHTAVGAALCALEHCDSRAGRVARLGIAHAEPRRNSHIPFAIRVYHEDVGSRHARSLTKPKPGRVAGCNHLYVYGPGARRGRRGRHVEGVCDAIACTCVAKYLGGSCYD
jgi:hypothetical protein